MSNGLYYIEYKYLADGEKYIGNEYVYLTPFGILRMCGENDDMFYSRESLKSYLDFYIEYSIVRVL